MSWRDLGAGELNRDLVGERRTLAGWVARRRDHGGLVFVDLRDSTGVGQLVVNPERSPEAAKAAHDIRNEFVLRATGEVTARSPENVNPNIPTGEVELQVDELEVISTSPPLPFQLDEENVDETLRIRYRWLDLRRDKLQRNLRLRAQMVSIIRRVMEGAGFLDIETPILFKPTPEGARDFLVPSRLQRGKFFALPQSPQILKQLLVIAGFERYYQIARCFRDEDLRADRFNELTQLDVEMAFPDVEFIIALMEEMVQAIWRETIEVELEIPFRRLTYADAMLRYGTDKPDLRFGLEIEDATELTRSSQFKVFADAPAVRYLTVPQEYSRADLERLEEFAKEWGAKGLAYIVYGEDGEARSPIAKFLSEDELGAFRAEPGSTVLFGADEPDQVARVLGALRLAPRTRAGARRRGGVSLGLGDRLPDVPLVGGGATAGPRRITRSPGPRRGRSRCSRRIPAVRSRSPTTSSPTARSSAVGRSGSTSRSSRRRSSTSCASRPRSRRLASASCSTR